MRKEELMDRITEVSTILPSINRHDVALRLQSYLLLSDLTATVFSKSPEPLWAASAIESARD
ncbi:MAG: hypothetical protein K2Z81_06245, partial [Cyanobacteria bacterium]|nr:hypothetical protein [Cyanobacteriota bacterium]